MHEIGPCAYGPRSIDLAHTSTVFIEHIPHDLRWMVKIRSRRGLHKLIGTADLKTDDNDLTYQNDTRVNWRRHALQHGATIGALGSSPVVQNQAPVHGSAG
jgi:hypothetical protein